MAFVYSPLLIASFAISFTVPDRNKCGDLEVCREGFRQQCVARWKNHDIRWMNNSDFRSILAHLQTRCFDRKNVASREYSRHWYSAGEVDLDMHSPACIILDNIQNEKQRP